MGNTQGVTFNTPSSHVLPKFDSEAARLMCAFQLLGMYELVPDTSYEALNQYCGREPGEVTAVNEVADRMLFDNGFCVISFSDSTFSFDAALKSSEVWRAEVLRRVPEAFEGRSDEEVRQLWHEWRRQQQGFAERRQQYISKITAVNRAASVTDLDLHLDSGHTALMIVKRNGIFAVDGLVYGRNGDGSYLAYNPLSGLLDMTADQLFPDGDVPMTAWVLSR